MKRIFKYALAITLAMPLCAAAGNPQKEYDRVLKHEISGQDSAKVMTLAENTLSVNGPDIPLEDLTAGKIYYMRAASGVLPSFEKYIRKYAGITPVSKAELGRINHKDVLIIGVRDTKDASASLRGISLPECKIIMAVFGAKERKARKTFGHVTENIVSSENTAFFSQIAAAEAIFGGLSDKNSPAIRLGYGYPEQAGMSSDSLSKIDAILRETVESGAAPGVHVLVARHGRVVYDRWYGTTMGSMDGSARVDSDMIYDMASVTKVMATLPFVMKLYEEGKIKLDDRLGDVMPKFKGTNKEDMLLSDILTHRAGLKAWIPYYLQTIDTTTRPPTE